MKVWDLRVNKEICSLNQKSGLTGLKDLQLLADQTRVGIRHDQGVSFWELTASSIQRDFDFSLENSHVFVLKDKRRAMINRGNAELIELSLANLSVTKRVELPPHVESCLFLPNGDVVLYLQKETPKKSDPSRILMERLKKNLISKRRKKADESDDEQVAETEEAKNTEHSLVFVHWSSQPGSSPDVSSTSEFSRVDPDQDFPVLFESEFELTSLRVVSNLDSESAGAMSPRAPFGFNSDVLSENQPELDNNTLKIFVGTENQQCFLVNVEISQIGEIYDHQIKEYFGEKAPIDEVGTPQNPRKTFAEQMLMNIDSAISETEGLEPVDKDDSGAEAPSFEEGPKPVHDFGGVHKKELVYKVVVKQESFTEMQHCIVSALLGGMPMRECHFPLGLAQPLAVNQLLKLQFMSDFNRETVKKASAFVFSRIGIGIVKFQFVQKTIRFVKFLRKEIDLEVGLCYSESKKAFYMSNGKNIQVWDKSLEHSLYNIDTSDKIHKILLFEAQNVLAIHDDTHYKEINTENLECRRQIRTQNRKALQLNMELVRPCLTVKTSHFIDAFRLGLILRSESLSLSSFPFVSLQSCFRDEDYETPILNFAEYYFHQLEELQHMDEIYGPLNPLIFCIYHNDTKLLETLISKYFYPHTHRGYYSPLEYAFQQRYQSSIKVICDSLVRREHPVLFSKADFHLLLASSFSYCHKLVATIPETSHIRSIPRLVFMNKNVQLLYCNNLSHLLAKIKDREQVC